MESTVKINYIKEKQIFKILPLKLNRSWMDNSRQKFAYKCLPLNIANQYGWSVVSPCNFTASWNGESGLDSIYIESDNKDLLSWAIYSHFGEAVLTIQVDFIIQTPENYSTYIRGIPNKDYGVLQPLDAIVETDWLPFTFTYNFKFISPGSISFKKDEPIFCFFPIERNTVENFNIVSGDIKENENLYQDYLEYSNSRKELSKKDSGMKAIFQRFYFNGRGPQKIYNIKNHIKKISFRDIK